MGDKLIRITLVLQGHSPPCPWGFNTTASTKRYNNNRKRAKLFAPNMRGVVKKRRARHSRQPYLSSPTVSLRRRSTGRIASGASGQLCRPAATREPRTTGRSRPASGRDSGPARTGTGRIAELGHRGRHERHSAQMCVCVCARELGPGGRVAERKRRLVTAAVRSRGRRPVKVTRPAG